MKLFRELMRPNMTFVDVGANIGCYTMMAAALIVPDGRVFAFEPHPSTAVSLGRNVAINGYDDTVTVVRQAVGDYEGYGKLYLHPEDNSGSSLSTQKHDGENLATVEITSLDGFFRGVGWPKIDLMKMDIEGGEISAIRGMRELVRRNPDLKLIVEFNPVAQDAAGVSIEEYFSALADCGFSSISLVQNKLCEVSFPDDVPLLQERARYQSVNLLCVKGEAR